MHSSQPIQPDPQKPIVPDRSCTATQLHELWRAQNQRVEFWLVCCICIQRECACACVCVCVYIHGLARMRTRFHRTQAHARDFWMLVSSAYWSSMYVFNLYKYTYISHIFAYNAYWCEHVFWSFIFKYMCHVCIHIYIHIYISLQICIHIYIYVRIYMYTHVYET
jgi:hypothetical protein